MIGFRGNLRDCGKRTLGGDPHAHSSHRVCLLYIPPRSRLLAWLTKPRVEVPLEIRARLIATYFDQTDSMVGGAIASLVVTTAAALRTGHLAFVVLAVLELALLAIRLVFVAKASASVNRGRPTSTQPFLASGLIWAALVGCGVGASVITGDHVLQVLSPVVMMGLVAGLTARNVFAPRFVLGQILLCTVPCLCAISLVGDPWLMILVLEMPIFFLSFKRALEKLHEGYLKAVIAERENGVLATRDDLTGLLNRHGIVKAISESLRTTSQPAASFLLFLDLDAFKSVNDRYGHHAGDLLLASVARRLDEMLPQDSLAARIGGDEFVVLVRQSRSEMITSVCQGIIDAMITPFDILPTRTITVGVSIGCAKALPGDLPETLLARADVALYRAKAAGKGRYEMASGLSLAA